MSASTSAKLPPANYRRIIEQMLVVLPDPVDKLKLLNRVLADCRHIPSFYRLYPIWSEIALRKMVIEEAEKIEPGAQKKARQLMKQGIIPAPRPILWQIYHVRHVLITTLILTLVWGMGPAVAALFEIIQPPMIAGQFSDPVKRLPRPEDKVSRPEIVKPEAITSLATPPPHASEPENLLSEADNEQQKSTEKIAFYLHIPAAESCFMAMDIPVTIQPQKPAAAGDLLADSLNKREKEEIRDRKSELSGNPGKNPDIPEYLEQPIWLVEKTGDTEIYSNRLQIITTHAVDNIPRQYLRLPRTAGEEKENVKTDSRIRGILYHASESDLYPLHPEMNTSIKKRTAGLVRYIKRHKCYHYFIDRFGRVYRIVQEDQAAFHAGRSIWADEESYYLNLNHAFIGICFEGRDFETIIPEDSKNGKKGGQPRMVAKDETSISEAQLKSGKELTDWLRVKYRLHEHNCVPHGLASVNHKRKLIGHHLDLSHNFPFERFGLNDKYHSPLPSIVDFGFGYDSFFESIFQGNPWPGVYYSTELMAERAKAEGCDITSYRRTLQKKFDVYHAMEKNLQTRKPSGAEKNPNKLTHTKTARKE